MRIVIEKDSEETGSGTVDWILPSRLGPSDGMM
jgi:hypothetical protein